MMAKQRKFSVLSVALLLACIVTGVGMTLPAYGDVGPDQASPGGVIMPKEETNTIRMKDEKVVFTIKQGTGPFASAYQYSNTAESSRYYAHVTATFSMQNLTDSKVEQNLLFPFHLYHDWGGGDVLQQAKNAVVKVNGKAVTTTFDNTPVTGGSDSELANTGHFSTSFAPHATNTILVEYDLRGIELPKSPNIAFEYMMQTGANWADTIGHGEVVFAFDGTKIDSTAPFKAVPSFFKVKDGKLVWEFDNLEPTALNDITVAFDPYILNNVWPKRQPFITNLTASTAGITSGICGNTHSQTNDCYSYPENGIGIGVDPSYVNAQAVNLLVPTTAPNSGGWLIDYTANPSLPFNEWLQFTFDGTYTFTGLQLRSGFLDTNPDYTNGFSQTPGNFYNSFHHAKTVVITFSDGTSIQTTLKDLPSKLQTISLPKKATTSLRITFVDTYPGTFYGNMYFGVGRVSLAGAQKAKEAASSSETSQQSVRNTIQLVYYGITAVAVLIVVLGAITYWLWRRKHVKR